MFKLILIIIAVLFVLSLVFRKKGSGAQADSPALIEDTAVTVPSDEPEYQNISSLIAKDEKFSAPVFTEKMSNLFIRYNNAVEDKNTDSIKPYFSADIIEKIDKSNMDDKVAGLTHVFRNQTVLSAAIKGWKTAGDNDIILCELRTRVIDYKVDAANNIVAGDSEEEKFLTYEWLAQRNTGLVTQDGPAKKAQNCPNCGAPVNINNSAECEYCGCVLNTDSFNWVVSEIRLISKRV